MSDHDASLDQSAHSVPPEASDGLLRAVDELRALEREKRLQEASGAPLQDLERRVEEKAQAVFRLAQEEGADKSFARGGGTSKDSEPDG